MPQSVKKLCGMCRGVSKRSVAMPQSVKTLCGICRGVSKRSAAMLQSVKTFCGICHGVSKHSAAYAAKCQKALRHMPRNVKMLWGYAAKCQNSLGHMLRSVKTLCGYAAKCQNSLSHMPRSVKMYAVSVKKRCDKGFNALPLFFLACIKRFIALIFCLRYSFYHFIASIFSQRKHLLRCCDKAILYLCLSFSNSYSFFVRFLVVSYIF
jgi:hypothetical protein